MSAADPWTCPTCKAAVATPYCPSCGEQPLSARHLTLRDLARQLLIALSNIDGRLLRSLRRLVVRPGALTVAYVEGRRQPFLGPLQLFLVANVLFFAVQSMSRTNVFSTPLASHLAQQDWSDLARALVSGHLAAVGTTLAAYAPLFDRAAVLNAKSLVILMVLAFAALLPIVFLRSRRPFAVHVVFSLHLYAFLLLLFCAALAVEAVDLLLGGGGLQSPLLDKTVSLVNLACCAVYLHVAIGRVYGAAGAMRIVKAAVLSVAVAALVLGYRFAIFLITLYTT